MVAEVGWDVKDRGWLKGFVTRGVSERYSFVGCVLDTKSPLGLRGGVMIKLMVWYGRDLKDSRIILNYDEGWDIRPKSEYEIELLNEICDIVINFVSCD